MNGSCFTFFEQQSWEILLTHRGTFGLAIQFEMSDLIEHESEDVMLQNEQDGFPDRSSCGYPSSFFHYC